MTKKGKCDIQPINVRCHNCASVSHSVLKRQDYGRHFIQNGYFNHVTFLTRT